MSLARRISGELYDDNQGRQFLECRLYANREEGTA